MRSLAMLYFSCFVPWFAAVAPSQQFAEAVPRGYAEGGLVGDFATGDIDGDGDIDVVTWDRIFVNHGPVLLREVATRLPRPLPAMAYPALGDVDGDGDLDVARAVYRGQNELWLNDGRGFFGDVTASRLPVDVDPSLVVAFADVDRDGDLDLFFGNGFAVGSVGLAQNRLYLNDGTGRFSDATATHLPARLDVTGAVTFGDVDRDGDADLVLGEGYQRFPVAAEVDRLLINDGSGRFADESSLRMPATYRHTRRVRLGDLDGDGDLDLLVGYGCFGAPLLECDPPDILINDGTGGFRDETTIRGTRANGQTADVFLADVDGDGDLDIVNGRVRRNDGGGVFALDPLERVDGLLGDIDGDGDVDGFDRDAVFANDGHGRFESRRTGEWLRYFRSDLADVDGDGVDDLTLTSSEPVDFATALRELRFFVLDLESDGDPDALDLRTGMVYHNDSTASLKGRIGGPVIGDNKPIVAGDVDGDGFSDLVHAFAQQPSATSPARVTLLRGDGTGRFVDVTASAMPPNPPSTNVLALGDVDGDGDLDVLLGTGQIGGWGLQDQLYRNDGSGRFTDVTATALPPMAFYTTVLSFADVDGDGDIDLLTGYASAQPTGISPLFLNDGTGVFTTTPPGRLAVIGLFVDVDHDGDPDVAGTSVAINDGSGWFVNDPARAPMVSRGLQPVGDIDLDGDIDLLPWRNRHRHLEAPDFPRIGRSYRIELFSQPGYSTAPGIAVPMLSFGNTSIETPLGLLALDPSGSTTLGAVVIPAPAGHVSVDIPVPYDAALIDLRVYWQAVVIPAGEPMRLTNSIVDQIIGG